MENNPLKDEHFERCEEICSVLTDRFGGHLPPPPLHPECLNTIMSNISHEEKMSPGHSFNLNVFI